MLTSATKQKINNARDILVGKIPMPTSQVEQITLALTYKFMSDMDKAARELGDTSGFFANGYEKYSWDKLMDKSLPARDRVKLYGEGLEKMALNPHIPQLFRDIFRNAFLPFNDPETLKLFLDTIDQFEYEHSEELGNAFEYLLQVMGSQGDAGQFRTPRHIIDFIVEVVDPKKTDKILDPACGTAGFLISAYKWLKINGLKNDEMETISNNFVGYDISQDMQRLSLVNMYLHQFPDPHIYEYDTLTSEERWEEDFDVILANPPFMTPKGGIKPHNRFSVPSKRAEVLFVDYIMEHLTVNGKAGVIVPEGIIFQSQNAYKKLRKMMVDDDYLWAVVSLPSGVFQPYSGVKTSVLLFDRQLAKKTNKILFIRVNNDGYDLGAQRRTIKKNDLPEATKILKDYKQSLVDGKEMDLEGVELAHVVEKKEVRDGGYNLSGEGYKKVIVTNSDYEIVELKDVVEDLKSGFAYGKANAGNEGIPHLRPMNITEEGALTLDGSKYLPKGIEKEKQDYLLKQGEVLFNNTNSKELVGKTCYIPRDLNAVYSNHMTRIRVNQDKLDSKYLAYILHSLWRKGHFLKVCNKWVGQAGVNLTVLGSTKIPLPPLSVQQEIVEELDGYQKIIDGARQVVENYQPSFVIEDDWEWKELSSIADITSGFSFKSNNFSNDNPIKTVKITNVGVGEFVENDGDYLPEGYRSKYSDYLLSSGDVVMALTRTIISDGLKVAMVPKSYDQSLLNQRVASIKGLSDIANTTYVYYVLRMRFVKDYVLEKARSLMQPNLSITDLKKMKIPIPDLKSQLDVVEMIQEEEHVIDSNRNFIKKYQSRIEQRINEIWGN